jgi:glycerol kinase
MDTNEIQELWQKERTFTPSMTTTTKNQLAAGWAKAVGAAISY